MHEQKTMTQLYFLGIILICLIVKLRFWSSGKYGITHSLPLLPGPLCSEVVILVRVSSFGQIDLFKNYLHLTGPCANKKSIKKQLDEKYKYESKMNVTP